MNYLILSAWKALSKGWKVLWKFFHKSYLSGRSYLKAYTFLGLILPKKTFPDAKIDHRYGVIICARNEHLVIGNLIDSIHAQNYDADKIHIFVIADNCTDNTAEICRQKGCTVYERFDKEHARKGYALQYGFRQIDRDFGIESLDGYIIFDADNLLHPDFIKELNKAFDTGAGIAVGYRNTKNFDRNFISAGYGIHFYKSVAFSHRPRTWLGASTHLAGTGFVLASRLVKDGWHYTCLTEDTQFTLNAIADGEKIVFCEDAEFFDEQPYEVRVMIRQRMRWVKGRLYAFLSTLPRLIAGIFVHGWRALRSLLRITPESPEVTLEHFWRGFSCYDMICYAFPSGIYYGFRQYVKPLVRWFCSAFLVSVFAGDFAPRGFLGGMAKGLLFFLIDRGLAFLNRIPKECLVVIRERKHIHCSLPKLIFYTLLSPWFDLIGAPLAICALFSTSTWKPIKHDEVISIDQLTEQKQPKH
ncbi:MAG: glycosyltransferase [Clostridia bacterium]|nr:glycosyltransferase [Clostridia bacterium]